MSDPVATRVLPSTLVGLLPRARNLVVALLVSCVATLAYLAVVVWLGQDYNLTSLTLVWVFGLATLGLALLLGLARQFSLAHAFFFALGAYAYAVLSGVRYGWPTAVAALAGIVLSAATAYAAGRILLRLEGFHFAVASLALLLIGQNLLFVLRETTGGDDGLASPGLELFGYGIDTAVRKYVLVAGLLALGGMVAVNLSRSNTGRSARALAADELMAASNGIDVVKTKVLFFVISAIYASTAGVLYAATTSYIFPTLGSVSMTLEFVLAVIVGGMGGLVGPVASIGLLRWLRVIFESVEQHLDLIYGIVLIALVLLPGRREDHPRSPRRWARRGQDQKVQVSEPALPSVGSMPHSVLSVRSVSVQYGSVAALSNVDLDVPSGAVVGVVGPNGAGKSTLLGVMSGAICPPSGAVCIGNSHIEGNAHHFAAAGIRRTFQTPRIMRDASLLENVLVGRPVGERAAVMADATDSVSRHRRHRLAVAEARAAIQRVGLAEFEEARAGTLSYGQVRLLELARALVGRPSYLLLDEPAAGLNDHETAIVGRLLSDLAVADGIGIVLVEHHLELVSVVCDTIYVLNFGELIARGAPQAIFADPIVIEAYTGARP